MSDESGADTRALESFRVCRDEVKHEYGVLANRLNSYITSQAFLVSGYAISMGNMNPEWRSRFTLAFPLLLCAVGILLSVRALPGIASACDLIGRWHLRQNELLSKSPALFDYEILKNERVKGGHESNLWFARTSPWIFGLAWLSMAALSIWLHF